jgi:RNA polymerase sigma-70 factor (ECF subfamily)
MAILRKVPDAMDENEQDLIRRVSESDFDAFRELFNRYQPVVFRRTLYLMRDADLAHDVVQEAFVRIWETRHRLRKELSFLALAFRISRNLVLDAARHRKIEERFRDHIPQPARSERDDPVEAVELSGLQEKLRRALNEDLGERCRTIFLLSRFERMSAREIAALLGIREKTVENQIAHALKVLRKKLAAHLDRGDGPASP